MGLSKWPDIKFIAAFPVSMKHLEWTCCIESYNFKQETIWSTFENVK